MIGFIGLGNMGSVLFKKIYETTDEKEKRNFYLYDVSSQKLTPLKAKKVIITKDLKEVFSNCKYVFFAVKPNNFLRLSERVKKFIKKEQILISVMAGLRLSYLKKASDHGNWIRVMPNSPCLIGEGVGAVSFPKEIGDKEKNIVLEWLNYLGFFFTVEEKYMDVVTAVTGSGPAFVFTFIQALSDAAVRWGLPRKLALESVLQLIIGSANLVKATKKHPYLLRDEVSSPGGTTIEGLAALAEKGFENSIHKAVESTYKKSIAISKD